MKGKFTITSLLALILLLSTTLFAYADDGISTSSKNGTVLQYGPDGGLLFTFSMTLESKLNWSRLAGQYTNFKRSEAILHAPKGAAYGLNACGTLVSLRPSTNLGSLTINLPYLGTYLLPPDTFAFYAGRISTEASYPWSTIATQYSPFSVTVENFAAGNPNPSKCLGAGGTITDSFTVSH